MGGAPSVGHVEEHELQEFNSARADILKIMDSPDWDDGSYAPLLIRLAWHSSGTYNASDGAGGSNGATMRHALEAGDPENAGLKVARDYLEQIKSKYPRMSYADIWILAAYCAIEHTGGPVIEFRGGRKDKDESYAIAPGRLPAAEYGADEGMKCDEEGRINGWEKTADYVRKLFGRMGLTDRELVALLCGGHVYGRCHTESSGYAGAWVENSTFFSNEYAADMIGDKWILVTNDTKMPDGGEVPEEVRPAPGKRQYIDLSKYEPEEDDEEQKVRSAPDAKDFPPGRYVCVSDWVNTRAMPSTESDIIGRFYKDQCMNLLSVKVFGTAIRGRAERGGWVSIIASGGKTLFERTGDIDTGAMVGSYRATSAVLCFDDAEAIYGVAQATAKISPGKIFECSEVKLSTDGGAAGAVFGKTQDGWALLYSPVRDQLAELIVEGYNEKPRKALKGQTTHQMMLITDMVLLWDPEFRKVLEEYAEDDQLLSKEFGDSFKRLTELGCPWSKDFVGNAGKQGGCGLPIGCH
jgi:hypothetical protein